MAVDDFNAHGGRQFYLQKYGTQLYKCTRKENNIIINQNYKSNRTKNTVSKVLGKL